MYGENHLTKKQEDPYSDFTAKIVEQFLSLSPKEQVEAFKLFQIKLCEIRTSQAKEMEAAIEMNQSNLKSFYEGTQIIADSLK